MTLKDRIRKFAVLAGLAVAVIVAPLSSGFAAAAAPGEPNKFVEDLSTKMLSQIKNDSRAKAGDTRRLSELVETMLMPNVDFERMTALSVGRGWRTATPEQKQQLMKEYKTLLIRTYAGAFGSVADQTIQMRPFRGEVKDDDVLVRSEVVQPRGEPVQLDYRLEQSQGQWRIYDVNVMGVWLVQTYRNQFGQEISKGGIDGLIKSLADRNRGAAK